MDGGEKSGGTFQLNTTQSQTFWGLNNWANYDSVVTIGGAGFEDRIVDETANWLNDEWAGYYVWLKHINGSVEIRTILSNTSQILMVSSNWSNPLVGSEIYEIYDNETLIFTALGQLMSEFNFPENAEGKMIELDISANPSNAMYVTLLSLGYKVHTGQRWRP